MDSGSLIKTVSSFNPEFSLNLPALFLFPAVEFGRQKLLIVVIGKLKFL